MARGQAITIRDVAQRAGVSITAVSHALNDKGTISAATRQRIRAVADEMGYEADALARGLRRSTMGAVGLVLRSLDALGDYAPTGVDVFERFVGVAASQALGRGLSLMLVPDLTRVPVPPLSFSMDGYIVTNPHVDDPVIALLEKRGIPYVAYGRDPSRPDFPHWASEDDAASARLVLDHLAAAGRWCAAPTRTRGTWTTTRPTCSGVLSGAARRGSTRCPSGPGWTAAWRSPGGSPRTACRTPPSASPDDTRPACSRD
jgi:DNA-binding LacI/PurR family transcriptional regulator